MKKIYIIIMFTLLLASSNCLAQYYSGVHDSLLFDGSDYNSAFIFNAGNNCKVKVTNVSGIATGSRCKMKIFNTCGQIDSQEVCEKGQIFPDDRLKAGDEISTGSNGYLTIMLSDGKTIRFGHNTKLVINSNYCDNNFATQVQLEDGELYINAKPNNKVKGINVITEFGSAVTEGTEFSYSSIKDGDITTDILKVYEGSVKFQKNAQNESGKKKTSDKGAEMKKIYEDYQSGKISAEEYMKKLKELQSDLTESLTHDPEIVNAGYQSKVVGTENATVPEPFDTNENRWWEEK